MLLPHLGEQCRPYRFDIWYTGGFNECVEFVGLKRLAWGSGAEDGIPYCNVYAVIGKDEGSIGCCELCVRHLERNKK
jgi:hypothetical protein